ncbi:hypothetical protein, partial [Candidatus Synechococcus spongiarum]|uniref:hypothetical protein n=1 Tax=Candidatus Synechococcus spongiarum TaxID=431041 RepID=UPI001378B040
MTMHRSLSWLLGASLLLLLLPAGANPATPLTEDNTPPGATPKGTETIVLAGGMLLVSGTRPGEAGGGGGGG